MTKTSQRYHGSNSSMFIDQMNMSMRCVLETIALKNTLSF